MKLLRDLKDIWCKTVSSPAVALTVFVICALFAVGRCQASEPILPKWDVVTRIGFAYKDAFSSSPLMQSWCKKAAILEPDWPENPRPFNPDDPLAPGHTVSCGGDNPAFVGYPIALKRVWFGGAFTGYFGPFHQSQWFDGNGEIQWTGPAVEVEINWSQRRRNRLAERMRRRVSRE